HRLGQGAIAGKVALRAASTVPADVEHHDVGMGRVHGVVVDAPSHQRTGPVAHHQHVADVEQPVEQLLAVRLAEVERDAALVATHALPHETDVVAPLTPCPHRVAGTRLLHLDDLCSELPARGPLHRPGVEFRSLDYAD